MSTFSPIPSYALGTIFTAFGLIPFFSPATDYEVFGLPLENAPQPAREKASASASASPSPSISPIVYARGIRDVTYGLLYLGLEASNAGGRNDTALNVVSAVVCLAAFVDGCVVWRFGGDALRGKAWSHWGMIGGLGAWVAWRLGAF